MVMMVLYVYNDENSSRSDVGMDDPNDHQSSMPSSAENSHLSDISCAIMTPLISEEDNIQEAQVKLKPPSNLTTSV